MRKSLGCLCVLTLISCGGSQSELTRTTRAGTCTGTFPSYWQDPAPQFAGMWEGQELSNVPPADWDGPVFRLSDKFPQQPVDDAAAQPWREARFDALFAPETDQATRADLAEEYCWAVMRYAQEGNLGEDVQYDWDVCENPVRSWFHMPFQTYDALSGREFTHGLTREAPVKFSVKDPGNAGRSLTLDTTMWAVAYFNATAAYTLGQVWRPDGKAHPPTEDLEFDEGAVVVKPLFNTSTPRQLPMLAGLPTWTANISAPDFCACKGVDGDKCTMIEDSQQCPRSLTRWGPVRLLQFDIAVKDSRAQGTSWVFGTFVADGQRKADEPNPWNRISPLGLMWGNDPPPAGRLAHDYPPAPRQNGFAEEVIFWDVVDMLNEVGGDEVALRPGHLGCNNRLNGPADNANSTCMSCHMTASVPDVNLKTPPIIAQFGGITFECVTPDGADPSRGVDRSGAQASVKSGVSFAAMDALYFANTAAGAPVDMTANTPEGPVNVLGNEPVYRDARPTWISLDYSLQLSISLVQWGQWQQHQGQTTLAAADRVHRAVLPGR